MTNTEEFLSKTESLKDKINDPRLTEAINKRTNKEVVCK